MWHATQSKPFELHHFNETGRAVVGDSSAASSSIRNFRAFHSFQKQYVERKRDKQADSSLVVDAKFTQFFGSRLHKLGKNLSNQLFCGHEYSRWRRPFRERGFTKIFGRIKTNQKTVPVQTTCEANKIILEIWHKSNPMATMRVTEEKKKLKKNITRKIAHFSCEMRVYCRGLTSKQILSRAGDYIAGTGDERRRERRRKITRRREGKRVKPGTVRETFT